MSATQSQYESNGKAVNVIVLGTILAGQPVYADGWLGVAHTDIESGASGAIDITPEEYQFYVPAAFSAVKGDDIYLLTTAIVGSTAPDAAYFNAAGANRRKFFKATSNVLTAVDGTKYMTGILLPTGQSL